MITRASHDIKEGEGKTAASVNLACLAAQEKGGQLIWGLDPKGAATFYFRIRPEVKGDREPG
jgi:MinD-like ATPase involved in chromosome partitioning or flagellar assembly